mmetsp:Transcript_80150/g.175800  ORF Transcript_80150/g.175800 Transcript_80150/m.175800 type:complete len:693 (-) Transcript_80150:65-2143(-)|eukprot:CAMPEP_0206554342 /NCGR_PEP_ID=MMETSP0325_2-20121206/17134_1 /ASSEMBLY_ACC=CAM_ASM_000347 /TAXON_ID=2866 /ORGANISM="Crypthecodinium cohnii, Strain Seligo" /LENGTH=692 /DNA_ID=CAMNT_0054054419 /DNA_START=31 /DNA_END=2109 /DNA_ORIENTATION=+
MVDAYVASARAPVGHFSTLGSPPGHTTAISMAAAGRPATVVSASPSHHQHHQQHLQQHQQHQQNGRPLGRQVSGGMLVVGTTASSPGQTQAAVYQTSPHLGRPARPSSLVSAGPPTSMMQSTHKGNSSPPHPSPHRIVSGTRGPNNASSGTSEVELLRMELQKAEANSQKLKEQLHNADLDKQDLQDALDSLRQAQFGALRGCVEAGDGLVSVAAAEAARAAGQDALAYAYDQIQVTEMRSSTLTRELNAARAVAESAAAAAADAEAESKNLGAQVQNLKKQLAQAQEQATRQLASEQQEKNTLAEEVQNLKKQLTQAQEQAQRQSTAEQQEKSGLTDEVQNLKKQLMHAKEQAQRHSTADQNEKSALKEEVQNLNKKLLEVSEEAKRQSLAEEQAKSSLADEVDNLKSQLSQIKAQADSQTLVEKQEKSGLATEVQNLQNQLAQMKAQGDQDRQIAQQLQHEKAESATEVQTLKSQMAQMQAQAESASLLAQREKSGLTAEVQTLKNQIVQLKEQVRQQQLQVVSDTPQGQSSPTSDQPSAGPQAPTPRSSDFKDVPLSQRCLETDSQDAWAKASGRNHKLSAKELQILNFRKAASALRAGQAPPTAGMNRTPKLPQRSESIATSCGSGPAQFGGTPPNEVSGQNTPTKLDQNAHAGASLSAASLMAAAQLGGAHKHAAIGRTRLAATERR